MSNYYRKRRKAFGYAINGLLRFFREEDHARIHLVAAIVVIAAAFGFKIATWEWVALLICIAMVLSCEAINSAIEQLTDLVSPNYLKAAGRVKDLAAGAVLIASIFSAIIGALIFIPKILELF